MIQDGLSKGRGVRLGVQCCVVHGFVRSYSCWVKPP
jgi:hypothetical protein